MSMLCLSLKAEKRKACVRERNCKHFVSVFIVVQEIDESFNYSKKPKKHSPLAAKTGAFCLHQIINIERPIIK